MENPFTYFADLAAETGEIQKDSIVSRTLFSDGKFKVILFGFDQGQELSEHTASFPAVLYFVRGEADLTLGGERKTASPGTFAHMQPRLPHSVVAKTPLVMLLILLGS